MISVFSKKSLHRRKKTHRKVISVNVLYLLVSTEFWYFYYTDLVLTCEFARLWISWSMQYSFSSVSWLNYISCLGQKRIYTNALPRLFNKAQRQNLSVNPHQLQGQCNGRAAVLSWLSTRMSILWFCSVSSSGNYRSWKIISVCFCFFFSILCSGSLEDELSKRIRIRRRWDGSSSHVTQGIGESQVSEVASFCTLGAA